MQTQCQTIVVSESTDKDAHYLRLLFAAKPDRVGIRADIEEVLGVDVEERKKRIDGNFCLWML